MRDLSGLFRFLSWPDSTVSLPIFIPPNAIFSSLPPSPSQTSSTSVATCSSRYRRHPLARPTQVGFNVHGRRVGLTQIGENHGVGGLRRRPSTPGRRSRFHGSSFQPTKSGRRFQRKSEATSVATPFGETSNAAGVWLPPSCLRRILLHSISSFSINAWNCSPIDL